MTAWKGGGLWPMITFDYERGEGGKKCQNIDYVTCERPQINNRQSLSKRRNVKSFTHWSDWGTMSACLLCGNVTRSNLLIWKKSTGKYWSTIIIIYTEVNVTHITKKISLPHLRTPNSVVKVTKISGLSSGVIPNN